LARFAEVAVEAARSLDRGHYTYRVPAGVEVVPGHRVLVPFGRRTAWGYVVALTDEDPGIELKDIERVDREPLLLPQQLELARDMADHYWVPLLECLRAMLPPRIRGGKSSGAGPSSRQRIHSRLLTQAAGPGGPPENPRLLTPAQREALVAIRANPEVLLPGITGSGKTEVYLAAAEAARVDGKQSLVLVPEIALTPQLVERFARRFGGRLAVLHSQLTELERAQQWWRARRGEVDMVIGSRSAVFAPLPRLGLVCVDEEGSSSYKQDRTPRYDAGWVARRLAVLSGARLVLGSATPSVATYRETETGGLALATLSKRVIGAEPEIELVDMREESAAGNRGAISDRLRSVVDEALAAGRQTILFLNRRGMATFVLCRDCGKAVQCPNCSVALVQHAELGGLACHYCGHAEALPSHCPYCGSRQIRAFGVGTQRLESLAHKLWPAARILRLDRDTASGEERYLEIFESFAAGRADILVGTQLVARGFDLPGVSAVGVVDADLPLHFPDYRAAENTFALVTQVAGRAGRAGSPARVVVQTSNPDHYALRRAVAHDYLGFYREELPSREIFGFPPFAELAVLTYSDEDPERAAAAARDGAEWLAAGIVREALADIKLLGPSPAFIHKLRGSYRWQITLKGHHLSHAAHLAPRGRGWSYDVDPVM
jgi:primosomal protein N' (replication factor Y) (superfamily II helicase)